MARVLVWMSAATLLASVAVLGAQASDEDVAKRQLESGRAFARQGNYAEALKDFRAVADTHATSSVADNALLEIARYYLDIAGNTKDAATAVDTILKNYATSDSAPDAYVLAGRLALARSHQPADLDAALANFERVLRLFPNSDVVPRSLVLAADTLFYAGRLNDALVNLGRVELEYPNDAAAADAHLAAGRVLLALGDPIAAMEELQQVRNSWSGTPQAADALARITLIHRLYVRAKAGPAFALSTETAGPAKLSGGLALAIGSNGVGYYATENVAGGITPNAPPAGVGTRPRGLALDNTGKVFVLEANALRPIGGTSMVLSVPRPSGVTEALKSADAAVQLSNGDWLVMDNNERGIQRFGRDMKYIAPFTPAKFTRLAVNAVDEVAGLDRDKKQVLFYDATAKLIGTLPLKGTGYEFQNPEDLAYDDFGHLYVLDRGTIAVFTPYAAAPATGAAAAPAPRATYRLLTAYSEGQAPTAFRRAMAFALDRTGAVYLYDDRAERVLVYR